jgi:hypothetical protein
MIVVEMELKSLKNLDDMTLALKLLLKDFMKKRKAYEECIFIGKDVARIRKEK